MHDKGQKQLQSEVAEFTATVMVQYIKDMKMAKKLEEIKEDAGEHAMVKIEDGTIGIKWWRITLPREGE